MSDGSKCIKGETEGSEIKDCKFDERVKKI